MYPFRTFAHSPTYYESDAGLAARARPMDVRWCVRWLPSVIRLSNVSSGAHQTARWRPRGVSRAPTKRARAPERVCDCNESGQLENKSQTNNYDCTRFRFGGGARARTRCTGQCGAALRGIVGGHAAVQQRRRRRRIMAASRPKCWAKRTPVTQIFSACFGWMDGSGLDGW